MVGSSTTFSTGLRFVVGWVSRSVWSGYDQAPGCESEGGRSVCPQALQLGVGPDCGNPGTFTVLKKILLFYFT